MTLDEILALRRDWPAAFDSLVAERVMGWKHTGHVETLAWRRENRKEHLAYDKHMLSPAGSFSLPRPCHADPASDLEAHRVACGWELKPKALYFQWLGVVLCNRLMGRTDLKCGVYFSIGSLEAYQPGDYATAALMVVMGGEQ